MAAFAGRVEAGIISRGQGHCASHAAAYRARCEIADDRTGQRFDYSRKGEECLFAGVYAPNDAPAWTRDRAQLWNHVEAFEKRPDSQLARELLISLPHELTADQNRQALQDFIKENITRKGLIADLTIHRAHQHGDERNIHAHLMMTLRKLDGTEFEAKKPRQSKAENAADLDGWKRRLEHHINRRLEREGFEPYYDLRSNAERGVDRVPQLKLGKGAAALERKGVRTDLGDLNREIAAENELRAANENQRPAANENAAEFVTTLDRIRQREAGEERVKRGSMDGAARRALDELARVDPLGTARHFGHHAGDRLKSPEDMRQEQAEEVRAFAPVADQVPKHQVKQAAPAPEIPATAVERPQEAPGRRRTRPGLATLRNALVAVQTRLEALSGRLERGRAAFVSFDRGDRSEATAASHAQQQRDETSSRKANREIAEDLRDNARERQARQRQADREAEAVQEKREHAAGRETERQRRRAGVFAAEIARAEAETAAEQLRRLLDRPDEHDHHERGREP